MPAKRRASADKKRKLSPSTQAGEFVKEEMEKFKQGRVKSQKQAVAIGLSEARRSGVKIPRKRG